MDIHYQKTLDNIQWQDVTALYEAVGWGVKDPAVVESVFRASTYYRFAFQGEKVVATGRTVDDGAFYGWVVDLIVLPAYQGQGIGSLILSELESELQSFDSTMLTAAPGKSGFYKKQGWYKQNSAFIYPRSEKKIQDFTDEYVEE